MIDLQQYRITIGHFSPKQKNIKFVKYFQFQNSLKCRSGQNVMSVLQITLKLVLILVLLYPGCLPLPNSPSFSNISFPVYKRATVDSLPVYSVRVGGVVSVWTGIGNFGAKYVNGNKKLKGIYNVHFNIRHLKYKVGEVKNIIKN